MGAEQRRMHARESKESKWGRGRCRGVHMVWRGAEGWAFCVWCADNQIGDAGVKHVSAMLEKNTTLLKLDLGGKHDEHGACRVGQRGEGQQGSGEMELLSGGVV